MAHFITRVELHHAIEGDYTNLHTYMQQAGFVRTITSDQGKVVHLPTATYYQNSSQTRVEICNTARAAANRTGKKNWVLTTEGPSAFHLDD